MVLEDWIAPELLEKFEFRNYNHALEIITQAFPEEWHEIEDCLRQLRITTDDLREAGGNETNIPKKFDDVLYPYGWREIPHLRRPPYQVLPPAGGAAGPLFLRAV